MAEHQEHIVGEDEIEITEELEASLPIVVEHPEEVALIEEGARLKPLSPLELQIAEESLNRVAAKDISKRLGVSLKVVRIVLGRSHVKIYIKDVFEAVSTSNKDIRIQLMSSLIEKKLEEEGLTSKLDLGTLLQMQDSMLKVEEQASLGSQGNIMVNILQAIRKD